MICGSTSYAQDFSNKGKDFWVAYGYHQIMNAGNAQQMVLYFAADQATVVNVSIPATGYFQTYNVAANSVVTSNPLPKAGAQDARLTGASTFPENKGIHITSDKPIVAYAHIYNASVSGATILFPTATLGKEYYSVNYTNISNSANSNCWFYVVAADAGSTTVEITPSAAAIGHPAGVPFTVTLTQGQVYNVMGTYSGNSGTDLTGSTVRSINTGEGCKRIGVFAGSGRISITCNGSASSSDNYMVQAFPKSAWGKKYLTASGSGGMTNNFYRVCVSDPATAVTINGAPIAVPLQNGFYYDLPLTSAPMRIEGNNPILVAQYFTSTQGNTGCGNNGPGDPEVMYLSSVEQNINKVLWNATPNFSIAQHFFNAIVPNGGTGISSFRLDGAPLPLGSFVVHPQDPNYSYVKVPVGGGQHTILSDSGFNAIAYGFGDFESYGYNAGTNIKDIYQYISVQNPAATINFPAACKDVPFYFTMTFPYQPTNIQWDLGTIGSFSMTDPSIYYTGPIVVAGKTLYQYRIPTPYTITVAGTYPIKITASNPTPDGCGGTQEIEFDLQVFDKPLADFNFTTSGCINSPVNFIENNNSTRPITARYWNFADATPPVTTTNPTHTYAAPGSYQVKFTYTNDIGCIADTARKIVVIDNPPVADFSHAGPYCVGSPVNFTDLSTAIPGGTYAWNFGDGSPVNTTQNPTHTYTTAGPFTVSLTVTSASGCVSLPITKNITVNPKPTADFALPVACLPAGTAQFNDGSTPGAGNTITTWAWTFGDAGTANTQNPLHTYTTGGPFTVGLTVTTNTGCSDTKTQTLTTIYAEPQAAFIAPLDVCLGSVVNFTDGSTAAGSSVTQWRWDFGDGSPISNVQNPTHTYTTAGPFIVTLNITSAAGCATVNNFATRTVNVRTLPTANVIGAATVCQNGTEPVITFTGAGGTAPYTFTYSIDNGSGPVVQPTITTVSGNSITLNVPTTVAGTFRYALVNVREGSTAACSQAQTGFIDVTVRPLPGATVTGATEVCVNAPSPTITFTGSNGVAPYTFKYRVNGGPIQTISTTVGNSVTVAVPTTATGTFTYELVDVQESSTSSCLRTFAPSASTAAIIVKPLPTATIIGSAEVCLNAATHNITFTGSGGTSPYQFRYRIVGDPTPFYTASTIAPSNTVNVPVPTNVAGTFTYQLLSVQEGGVSACSQPQTGSVTTTVNPLPTANFAPSPTICVNRVISFNDLSVPGAGNIVSWAWNFGDPNASSSNPNTSTVQNPTHIYTVAGTYDIKLIVTTDKGCESIEVSKSITVNVNPTADFTTPIACVADVNAQFTDLGTVNPGTVTGWDWNFGDPNSNGANPNTSTVKNPTHHFTVAGPYTVRQIVISNTGCRDTTSKTFTVNDLPVSNFTIENTGSVCSNQSITIKDAATTAFGTITKLEIFWDYLNDPTAKTTDATPVAGKTYTNTYAEFGTPLTKTFRIRYVAYTGDNCISSFERDVTLLATPTLAFAPVPGICSDVPAFQITQAQLLNALPGGPAVFSGNGVSSTGLFNPAVAGVGTHTIRYTYTGTNGCTNFLEQPIEVYPDPVLNAGPDKVVLEGGQVMLTPASNIGLTVTYLWTPALGLNDPTSPFPIASPATDITYTLTVTSDKGCTDSDDVFVKVLKNPLIPNIFSPNGDRVHDTWVIAYLESYPGCTVDLYNRYGQLVYHSVGYSTPWDGKVNGKDVPVGTYYYVIDPKNGRGKLSGYVDVIR